MFEGSANVPKGEHFKLVSAHGGNLNGTTSSDRTNYFEMLPASELPLALWLEADRMKSLNVSTENFENQRKVVQEEYRMRVSNVAYAPAQIRLEELVFQGYWPYEHDAIGSMQDLDNAQLEWVRAFHDSYYAPNLAVLFHRRRFRDRRGDAARATVSSTRARSRRRSSPTSRLRCPSRRARARHPRRLARQDTGVLLWMGHPRGSRGRSLRARAGAGDPQRRRELAAASEARSRQGPRAGGIGLDRRPPRSRHVRHPGEARRRGAHRPTRKRRRRHHRRAHQRRTDRRRG